MDCSQPGSSVHGILQARMLELFPSPDDLPNPGIEPMSPALQVDSLPTELPGKPINIGLSCHALLERIFPTQGSNPGLPHYRLILYSLSHQESPRILGWVAYPFSRESSQPRNFYQLSYQGSLDEKPTSQQQYLGLKQSRAPCMYSENSPNI